MPDRGEDDDPRAASDEASRADDDRARERGDTADPEPIGFLELTFAPDGSIDVDRPVVTLEPEVDEFDGELGALVDRALDDDRYAVGDWYDFPAPVYLVRDRDLASSFRLAVRTDRLDLHGLPSTHAGAIDAIQRRLETNSAVDWTRSS